MENQAPVEVDGEYDVTIEAIGGKGDGIAKINGFVIFVPDTQVDEQCRVKVSRILPKMGFAEKI